mgnify:FL=1
MEVNKMKTLLTLIFTGILFFISVTTTAALDVVNNELLDQKHEQVLKMKLADDDLTIFLVDTSGNMQNTDKQMTIDLITRFAQESGQAKIAVMSYGNDSQILVEPTTDRDLIREKLANLSTGGESNLTAGLKAAETLAKQQSNLKANLFIIADNAPTTGDTLKKGIYNSKDSHSYKYANAAHEYANKLKSSNIAIRALVYLSRVPDSRRDHTQRFFENIQTHGFFDLTLNHNLDFLFEHKRPDATLLTGQFNYGVQIGNRDGQTQFHYSDDYFKEPRGTYQNDSSTYNPSLATMSLNLELSAWASPTKNDYLVKSDNAKKLLGKLGFEHFEANDGFKVKPTKDSIGAVAAETKLTIDKEDYTLIALAIRGGGYEAEWASNVTMGKTGQHQGFEKASQDVLDFLDTYIKKNKIKGKVKLWLTGYSRGAATANLIAGELNNGRKLPQVTLASSDLYAFCFEPPAGALENSGVKDAKHNNIVNIVNLNDVVTKVAPNASKFEFSRYGDDTELPTKEKIGNSRYYLLRDRMLRELEKIETQKGYIIDDFKWKKIGLNINLSSIKFIVTDNNRKHILNEYLEKIIETFAIEELLNRDYYVTNHQNSMREMAAALLGDSDNKNDVKILEIIKILVDLKATTEGGVFDRLLLEKLGISLGIDKDNTELSSTALELIGEFMIKHPNLGITLLANGNIINSAHQPELCLAWLRSQDKNYTDPIPIVQNRTHNKNTSEKKTYYKTNVKVEGEKFGTILGGGLTLENDKAELYAIPNEKGQFDGWYKDGVLISKELECDYTVIAESNLVAKFSAKNGAENEK